MTNRLKPLAPYLRRYWKSLAWGGVAVVLYNTIKVLIPLVIGHAIDDMRHGFTEQQILLHGVRLFGIAILSALFLYITRQVIIGASREIEFDLRNDLFRNLERQSAGFYHTHRTGDIMARTTNDLAAVRQLLGPAIMYSANTLVFTAAALPFMYRISPRLTLFAFVPLPIASVIVQYFGARIHTRFERIQAMFSDISAKAQENFSGARLIRAFAQEEAEIASFETANLEYIRRSLHLVRLMAMLWPTLEFVLGLSLMITLFVGGHEVLLHHITVGQFTSFNVYMVQLTWPMIAIGWVVNLFQRGTASVVRIDELLKQQPSIADDPSLVTSSPLFQNASSAEASLHTAANRPLIPPAPESSTSFGPSSFAPPLLSSRSAAVGSASPSQEPTPAHATQAIQGSITFQHLNFSYLPNTPVLRDINLHIPAGSSLAIVGPTGSGKVHPRRPRTAPSRHLAGRGPHRRPPHPLLHPRPAPLKHRLRPPGNLPLLLHHRARTSPWASSPQTRNRSRQPPAPPTSPPKSSSSPRASQPSSASEASPSPEARSNVPPSPAPFSATRASSSLDDALASVDTFTEEQILSGLRQQMLGRTTILISHRVSTARNADQIAVLVDGRIVELGTHDELIIQNGYYTSLAEKQQLEEELAVTA